ncbi:MAG: PASTA domain-containing protein [Lachnospiraceae bacterium]|jgi:beta-lactam-binding protein with PASTA domain|nr:PASTA domain-containing protein [Lachnospiraceae bacterium]
MERLCMGCMKRYDDKFDICPHCGYAFDTPAKQSYHIPPGSVLLQRYIVGKVLGFGGFGVTYVGWDYLMERKVAIKEYLPSEFATRMPTQQKVTVYSGDREEQFKEGLIKTLDEAKRLAKFESVPGIVQIYDCFEANGTSYIVMEFLEGMSLKEYLAEHGKMSVDQALQVILQITPAMEAVHKTGILHRDIAPDNIYVLNPEEPDNLQVKLLDFGAARYATTKHSKSLSVIIKPGYAPEEQYRSRGDQGTWTDVYALAATLYKMLTGITLEDAMERSVKDEVKKPSKLGIKLSKPMETALMNALNVKIQDRTQTMEEFSKELLAAEVKERSVTKDKRDVGAVPRWFLALAGIIVAAVAVVAGLMITGIIQFHLGSDDMHVEENMTRVPNVVNQDADEAETLLASQTLGMSRDKMVYSKEIPANRISYQEIKENTLVEKDTTLVVLISKGEEKGVIPSVKGLQKEEAEKILEEAGFTNIRLEESQEEGVYNSVLKISEEQGDNVVLDKEIVLTICVNEENQLEDESVQIEVPKLDGMEREEAGRVLEEAGFLVNWIEEASDEPKGTILGHTPKAGEKANKGSYVTVRISAGAEKIYMKNVQLMSLEEARGEIESLGLKVGKVTEDYSDSVPNGKVISQSVAQDAEVKKGDSVNLVISKGKDPAKQTKAARQTQPAAQTQSKAKETAPPTTAAPPPEPTAPPATTAPPETAPPATAPPQTAPPETAPPAGETMPDINW